MQKDSYKIIRESKTLRTLFFIILSIVVIGLLYIFWYYLLPFMLALGLYISLIDIHNRILNKVKKRVLSANIMILILTLIIILPTVYLLISLSKQGIQLYNFIQGQIEAGILTKIQNSEIVSSILNFFNLNITDVVKKLSEIAQATSGKLLSHATKILTWPISFTINLFFMFIMLFFLFKDGENLGKTIYFTLPFPDDLEKVVANRLVEVVKVLLAGNLFMMFLQGTMVGIGLYIVGNKTPLLWASIAAILSLIPVIGTTFIWIPGVVYLAVTGSYGLAIFLGIWCFTWYLLIENVLKPKVFGDKLNFHPILFFFLLLGSIQAFNLLGVLVGPILLTLFYSLWEIYKLVYHERLSKNASKNKEPENLQEQP